MSGRQGPQLEVVHRRLRVADGAPPEREAPEPMVTEPVAAAPRRAGAGGCAGAGRFGG